jgi:hypothetical protein
LALSARKGNITLDGLIIVAKAAVDELSDAKKYDELARRLRTDEGGTIGAVLWMCDGRLRAQQPRAKH